MKITPPKINMEPENELLEEEIPIKNPSFSGSMLIFGGCMYSIIPSSISGNFQRTSTNPQCLDEIPTITNFNRCILWQVLCPAFVLLPTYDVSHTWRVVGIAVGHVWVGKAITLIWLKSSDFGRHKYIYIWIYTYIHTYGHMSYVYHVMQMWLLCPNASLDIHIVQTSAVNACLNCLFVCAAGIKFVIDESTTWHVWLVFWKGSRLKATKRKENPVRSCI